MTNKLRNKKMNKSMILLIGIILLISLVIIMGAVIAQSSQEDLEQKEKLLNY